MLRNGPANKRELKLQRIACDLAVVGGGMAGSCCAITAARAGLKVTLIQDRPLLGGNASSEVRLWILGATSHMGNNNRWAREGGVLDEILVENTYRNPEGNPLILDTLLLEKVSNETNITLLLNTTAHDLEKSDPDTIKSLRAFCSQNSTAYEVSAPLFVDASGDGIVGFLAGAAFRMGTEASAEFGEKLAPREATSELLGHTIYFYSKDTGRPVRFMPPSYALKDITKIPRYRDLNARDFGCRLWWIEWGGQLDTIHDAEEIKWELWKVVYGVWNHVKNSGKFPEAETLTLEWVGTIPGKRESRRFEGDYMLTQQDVVEQRRHVDAVSYGGWAIDLHPSDGVFSEKPGCAQYHSKGVYQIPYRCLYSRNITNLFLAGRLISASHVAFGSTRVMATCSHNAQAVAVAAALCLRHQLKPRGLLEAPLLQELQRELLRSGQYIPEIALDDPKDLVQQAALSVSSELRLAELTPNDETLLLTHAWAMMLPLVPGPVPEIQLWLDARRPTTLRTELRVSSKPSNHTPDVALATLETPVAAGTQQPVTLRFPVQADQPRYAFVCLLANDDLAVHLTDQRVTGVLSAAQKFNRAVAKSARQEPPPDSGIDSIEFWLPQRRPGGKNFALRLDPPIQVFGPANLINGIDRPANQPNAWVAAFDDPSPTLTLRWPEPRTIARIELLFDTDYDHPMESVFMGHPERVMPFCVQGFEIVAALAGSNSGAASVRTPEAAGDGNGQGNGNGEDHAPRKAALSTEPGHGHKQATAAAGKAVAAPALSAQQPRFLESPGGGPDCVLARVEDNHQSRRVIHLPLPVTTAHLEIRLKAPGACVPAALFSVRCYGPA